MVYNASIESDGFSEHIQRFRIAKAGMRQFLSFCFISFFFVAIRDKTPKDYATWTRYSILNRTVKHKR